MMKLRVLALALSLSPTLAVAQKLDLGNPDDALRAMRKIQSSLQDGKPTIFYFRGNVYSRVAGERDRQLFTYEAMNVRATRTVTEPGRGYGYSLVSREVLLYLDPQTRQVLRTWKNPWTGKEVEVVHIANDPVNFRPTFAQGERGAYRLPATIKEGWGAVNFEVPLFYPNALGGEYQPYVGGTYQAVEMFGFFFREAELLGPADEAPVQVSWARVCQWLPWMEMEGREGYVMFSGVGGKVAGFGALPQVLRGEIEASYPEYKTPPPLDDARPNETSWTYFKKKIDARRKGGAK